MTDTLEQKIHWEVASFPGKAAVLLSELPAGSGHSPAQHGASVISLYAADQVVSASTIKVPVAMAMFHKLREEKKSPDEKLHLDAKDILDDSEVFEYGSTDVSFRDLAYWMLVNSDNTATNAIFRYLGFPYMNAYFRKIGLACTRAERCMLDWTAVSEGRNNYISANDFFRCCQLLLAAAGQGTVEAVDACASSGAGIPSITGQPADNSPTPGLADSSDAAWIMRTLAANRDYTCMMRYITEDVTLMHKTGELDDIIHDAGVFEYAGKRWFLGVFCSEFEPTEEGRSEARRLIGRIARLTLDEIERVNSASSAEKVNLAENNAAESNAAESNSAEGLVTDVCAWQYAIVTVPSAFLWSESGETTDEVLSGWAVRFAAPLPEPIVIHGRKCVHVETHYGYKGYLPIDCCSAVPESLIYTRQMEMITALSADVLSEPRVQGRILETLHAGSLVERVSDDGSNVAGDGTASSNGMSADSKPAAAKGYTLIRTADGTVGYIPTRSHKLRPDSDGLFFAGDRAAFLHGQLAVLKERWESERTGEGDFETSFRRRIAETAKSWIGTQYRWGGHTPAGTDCSGLVFMACMLNGLLVYRDAHMPEEYLVSEIYPEREEDLKMGDFIFFEGHVAMSLGGKRFIHSTGFARNFGVCIGSLDPSDPGYRPDLDARERWYGSLFPPKR